MLTDGRGVVSLRICRHVVHRHSGAYGGRCTICRAAWCTLLPYGSCGLRGW